MAPTPPAPPATLADLHTYAHHLGLTIHEHAGLDPASFYDPVTGRIHLDQGLHPAEARSRLAHELGHAHHQHTTTQDPVLKARQERQADRFAARLLISPVEYATAETLVGTHVGALARELEVTNRMITVWRDIHDTPGNLRVG